MKLLIVDIDDTLFDWLRMWSTCFGRILSALAVSSSMSRDDLIRTFRALHVAARTSERGLTGADATALGVAADTLERLIVEHEISLDENTKLFPGVMSTVYQLGQLGVRVVAHTDTPIDIAADRFVRLGLDGVVDALFATASGGVTTYRRARVAPKASAVTILPYVKPDPRNVALILARYSIKPSECIYVGDSKVKDIPMARAAGVLDIFASYGCRRSSDEYDLLRSVSHWTDEDIAQERSLLRTEATHSISSFEELLRFLA